jgi:hypothetical protein
LISYRALRGRLLTAENIQELEESMSTRSTCDPEIGQIDLPDMQFESRDQSIERYNEQEEKEDDVLDVAKHVPKCVDAAAAS